MVIQLHDLCIPRSLDQRNLSIFCLINTLFKLTICINFIENYCAQLHKNLQQFTAGATRDVKYQISRLKSRNERLFRKVIFDFKTILLKVFVMIFCLAQLSAYFVQINLNANMYLITTERKIATIFFSIIEQFYFCY